MLDDVLPAFEDCYRAVRSREARFDGWFVVCVTSTGIYCRPSCPATTPRRANVRFFPTAAAAQQAGFRACFRCRPDAVPGSPAWNPAGDVASRAIRMIEDGIVDREGVPGLASRLGYSGRQLQRILAEQFGAGPQTLARAARAHTARVLLQTTRVPVADVAYAAGFGSVRQFNDTIRDIFGANPLALRQRGSAGETRAGSAAGSPITVRIPYRRPYDAGAILDHLADRAIPGLEEMLTSDGSDGCGPHQGHRPHQGYRGYRRVLRLHHGIGIAEFCPDDGFVRTTLALADPRDLTQAIARCRRLWHADADPAGITDALGDDPVIGPLVRRRPGLRIPGSPDIFETVVRAIVGQQVSIRGARTVAARLVARHGTEVDDPTGGLSHAFPDPAALAGLDPADASMPRSRATALATVARATASGGLSLHPGSDPAEVRAGLLAVPGIGPWTAEYVALRGLGSPDAFPGTDLGIRQALAALGVPDHPTDIARTAASWRPLRSYAAQHLWTFLAQDQPDTDHRPANKRSTP